VVAAPAVPAQLPSLLRGIIGLATSAARLTTFSFQDRPVVPGDRWTHTLRSELSGDRPLEATSVSGAGIGRAEFRFDHLERSGGRRIAVISATTQTDAAGQEPSASATLRFTGTARLELDLDTGTPIRTEMTVQGVMAGRTGSTPVRLHLVQAH